MNSNQPMASVVSPWRSWKYVIVSGAGILLGTPLAATFSSPTLLGYVQWPGILVFLGVAVNSVVCFVFWPCKPLLPKLLCFALAVFPLFNLLEWLGYDYLHFKYGS